MPRASVYTISNAGHMDPEEAELAEARGQIVAFPPILQPDVIPPPDGEGIVPPAGSREVTPLPAPSQEPPAARGSRMGRSYGHEPGEFEEAPNKSAPKAEWVDHAVAKGMDRGEAESETKADLIARSEEGDWTSAGTSSLTSESRPDRSGDSLQDTGSSRQSPAPTTESHSSQDRPAGHQASSTAGTASGSTQRTGTSPQSPPRSSGQHRGPQGRAPHTPGRGSSEG